jgi:hypothetical protein
MSGSREALRILVGKNQESVEKLQEKWITVETAVDCG